jgi:O-antigen ligase
MCAAPALIPIHVLPLPTFYEEWLAGTLGIATCAALLVAAWQRGFTVPQTVLPLFGFLIVLALQVAFDRVAYAQQATLAMLYTLYAMAVAWCGLQLRKSCGFERAGRVVATGLLAGGVLSALLALLQVYAPASWLASFASPLMNARAYGNLGQANLFADQLALAAASLLYLQATGALRMRLAILLGVLLAVGLTLSGSRSVWLYGAWILGWTIYVQSRTVDPRYRGVAKNIAAALAVLAVLAFVLPPVVLPDNAQAASESGLERLASFNIGAGRAGSEGLRLYFWRQAWQMFESAPLLGVGFGHFAWAFLQQSPSFADFGYSGQERNAHNLVLHLLAETGFAGAVFVVIALGLWFWRAARAEPNLERWWVVATAGVIVLHSMVEYPLWYANFLGPFALLIGLGETRDVVSKQGRLVRAALVGVVILGAAVLGSLFQGVRELRTWVYLLPEEALREPTVVARQMAVMRALQPTLLGPYVDLPFASTIRLNPENLDAKLAFNNRVMRFAPIAPVVLRQVVFLTLAGRGDEAKHLLDDAAVIYPGELAPFAADLDRLAARGLPVTEIAAYLAEKQRKN